MNGIGEPVHVGRDFGGRELVVDEAVCERYLAALGQRLPLYREFAPALVLHSECYEDLSWYLALKPDPGVVVQSHLDEEATGHGVYPVHPGHGHGAHAHSEPRGHGSGHNKTLQGDPYLGALAKAFA